MKISKYLFILFLTFQLTLLSNLFSMAQDPTESAAPSNTYLQKFEFSNFFDWFEKYSQQQTKNETFLQIIKKFNETNIQILEQMHIWPNTENHLEIQKSLNTVSQNNYWSTNPLLAYTQKLKLNENETCLIFGDLHANFYSLFLLINDLMEKQTMDTNLKLQKGKFLVFLGDYMDRNNKNLETLATVMLLKIINPYQVFTIRGNHEDLRINHMYKFHEKLKEKFTDTNISADEIQNQIGLAYELMPSAIYLGHMTENITDLTLWVHLSHGGVEIRYNPKKFLDYPLTQTNNFNIQFDLIKHLKPYEIFNLLAPLIKGKNLLDYFINPDLTFGFRWNDLNHETPHNESTVELSPRGTAIIYSPKFIEEVFKKFELIESINCINLMIRGHQHQLPQLFHGAGLDQPCPGYAYFLTDENLCAITLISSTIFYEYS